MELPINKPPIPGFFYEVKTKSIQVGVHKVLGSICILQEVREGRASNECMQNLYSRCGENHARQDNSNLWGDENFNVDRPAQPLFTNKTRELRNLEKFRTTRVNLFVYPHSAPSSSADDDSELEPSSNGDGESRGPPTGQELGEM